ncbi:hypothetical protein RUM43_000379 [Polyplax serrata]|uniref:Uncharacterized protein n=1 Tax=Polyplax serrata TaxID=468196 RepID=A0AAN8XS70_POLSC
MGGKKSHVTRLPVLLDGVVLPLDPVEIYELTVLREYYPEEEGDMRSPGFQLCLLNAHHDHLQEETHGNGDEPLKTSLRTKSKAKDLKLLTNFWCHSHSDEGYSSATRHSWSWTSFRISRMYPTVPQLRKSWGHKKHFVSPAQCHQNSVVPVAPCGELAGLGEEEKDEEDRVIYGGRRSSKQTEDLNGSERDGKRHEPCERARGRERDRNNFDECANEKCGRV